jgi:hypothetical protein
MKPVLLLALIGIAIAPAHAESERGRAVVIERKNVLNNRTVTRDVTNSNVPVEAHGEINMQVNICGVSLPGAVPPPAKCVSKTLRRRNMERR